MTVALALVGEDLKVTTVEKRVRRGGYKSYRYVCTCHRRGQWHDHSIPAQAVAVVHAVLHHNAPRPRG